jgi:transcriptional regulator with XRE-family HTH domain
MASTRTTTKTIRISNEVAEFFREKPLNRAVESLYELMAAGSLIFDGEEIKIGCVHQNSEKSASSKLENDKNVCTPDYEQIVEMAILMNVTAEKLFSDIKDMLENGELYYSGSRLVNPRYEEFESLCERKKWDIDKTIEKVVREMGG